MPEAADRALVSVATAYRYFASAEDLWWEASTAAIALEPALSAADELVDAAGDDPAARLEALIRTTSFHMFDDQAPYRRLAKAALDQWFTQVDTPEGERAPVREGRRNDLIAMTLEPLRGRIPKKGLDRIAHALGVVVGTDAMLALIDGVRLPVPDAKKSVLDASRWILAGALAELGHDQPQP
jgi:AcrR family transcriptional regulator